MEHTPEGQEIFTDGIQPVDVERILGAESDPYASKATIEKWEEGQFGNKGDTPIDEDEKFRLLQ